MGLESCFEFLDRFGPVAGQPFIEPRLILHSKIEPLNLKRSHPLTSAPPFHDIEKIDDRIFHAGRITPVRFIERPPGLVKNPGHIGH